MAGGREMKKSTRKFIYSGVSLILSLIVFIGAILLLLLVADYMLTAYPDMDERQEACGDGELLELKGRSFKCAETVNGKIAVTTYYKINDKWFEVEK